jgi:hypothetical protein
MKKITPYLYFVFFFLTLSVLAMISFSLNNNYSVDRFLSSVSEDINNNTVVGINFKFDEKLKTVQESYEYLIVLEDCTYRNMTLIKGTTPQLNNMISYILYPDVKSDVCSVEIYLNGRVLEEFDINI